MACRSHSGHRMPHWTQAPAVPCPFPAEPTQPGQHGPRGLMCLSQGSKPLLHQPTAATAPGPRPSRGCPGEAEQWSPHFPFLTRRQQQTPWLLRGKFISRSEKEKQGQAPVHSRPGPDRGGWGRGRGDGSSRASLVPRLSWLGPGRACWGWWHRAWGQRRQASGPRGRHIWRQ